MSHPQSEHFARRCWTRARARWWARYVLARGRAVILDTETTDLDGQVVQIAVIDLAGRVLLDSLVRPSVAIAPDATAVHGITDLDVQAAPQLHQIAAQLLEITAGRPVLAYNAPFDRQVLTASLIAAGVDPGHLARPSTWACLMRARCRRYGQRRQRLGGDHSAVGDCRAALAVLREIARPGPARPAPSSTRAGAPRVAPS